jgi:anthranilate phosphoribosyltransferase
VASGKACDLGEGLDLAKESIESGAAKRKLQLLVRRTNSI